MADRVHPPRRIHHEAPSPPPPVGRAGAALRRLFSCRADLGPGRRYAGNKAARADVPGAAQRDAGQVRAGDRQLRPTIQKNQLLRPYPNINGLSTTQYYGKAKNNSLQVVFLRRLSKGLNLSANYTYSDASVWNLIVNQYDAAPQAWTPTNIPLPNRVNVVLIDDQV